MAKYSFICDGKDGCFDSENLTVEYDGETTRCNCNYKNILRRLYIIFTKECNLHCSYCFQHNDLKYSCKYKTEEIVDILKKSIDKFDEIVLFGGEPLLDNNLEYIVNVLNILTDKPIYVFTNGNISQRARYVLISEKVSGVVVTLDGTKQVHDVLRPNLQSSSFDNALETVRVLCNHGLFVQIQINVGEHNLSEAQKLIEYLNHSMGHDVLHVMLNPLKYSQYSLKQADLVSFYVAERKRFPSIDIQLNSRLIRNLISLLTDEPIEKERCAIGKQVVADFSDQCVYACPQNVKSIIGYIDDDIHYEHSKIAEYTSMTNYSQGDCKTCEYSRLCAYGCPFEDTHSMRCKEDIDESLSIIFRNFNTLFDVAEN